MIRRLAAVFSPKRVIALVLLVVLVGTGIHIFRDTQSVTVTAYFTSSEGLYPGDEVKVMGVPVGSVLSVEPEGDRIRVEIKINSDQPIPRDARAAIVAPSLVTGRFIQLEPVWTSGPTMADGDKIDLKRTAIPVSFDEVKAQLTDLSTVLGPQTDGNQAEGDVTAPLAEAITTIEKNLRNGNATQLRESVTALRDAAATLSDGRSDLFSTVNQLNTFTRNLAINDAAVRGFTDELSGVSTVLLNNRTQLTSAMKELTKALAVTDTLLTSNRTRIQTTAREATELSATLADQSDELAGVLHVAPHSLMGLHNIVENQAITGRATLSHLDGLSQLLCGAILSVGGGETQCRSALEPLLGLVGLNPLKIPGLTPDTTPNKSDKPVPSTSDKPAPAPQTKGADVDAQPNDLFSQLSGLLGGKGAGK